MSLMPEGNGKLVIQYSPDDTFQALLEALNSYHSKFKIQSSNDESHTLFVKSGVSMRSWGENLQISIIPSLGGFSEINISSKSKFGLMDMGKNQDNINNIMGLLTEELNGGNYSKVQSSDRRDIPTQIKQLSDLKDSGVLTEEEFKSKKAELLAKM